MPTRQAGRASAPTTPARSTAPKTPRAGGAASAAARLVGPPGPARSGPVARADGLTSAVGAAGPESMPGARAVPGARSVLAGPDGPGSGVGEDGLGGAVRVGPGVVPAYLVEGSYWSGTVPPHITSSVICRAR